MTSDSETSSSDSEPSDSSDPGWIVVHLDELLKDRGLTLTELAGRIGLTPANLSILKTGKAKGIRFTTLVAICAELDCQPADILSFEPKLEPLAKRTPGTGVRMGEARVVLIDSGPKHVAVIKVTREMTGAQLKTAKLLVDSVPSVVASSLSRADAEALVVQLRRAGAKAEID